MKTRKLRLIALALLVLLVFVPTTAVSAAIPSPTSDFYVADYAEVLDSDLEAYIIEKNISLYENTGAQIVVVTVDYLDGMEIEDYAYTLFNQWKIGSAQKNNGVLLLMVVGENRAWALQGKGLEHSLPSGELGQILNTYLKDDFLNGRYSIGTRKTFDVLYSEVAQIYGFHPGGTTVSPQPTPKPKVGTTASTAPRNTTSSSSFSFPWGILILILIVYFIARSKRRRSTSSYRGRRIFPPYISTSRRRYDDNTTRSSRRSKDDDDDSFFGGSGGGFFSGGGGSSRGGGGGFSGGGSSSRDGGGFSGGGGSSRGGGGGF